MEIKAGILLGDSSNPFWDAMQREYEALASRLGFAVECVHAHPDKDPQAQCHTLRQMLGRGYDALVINPLGQHNLVPAILEAAEKRIPVIDVGGKTDEAAVASAGDMFVPVLTVDFWEQGRMAGRYLAQRLNLPRSRDNSADGAGTRSVVMVQGRSTSKQSLGRVGGASETLSQEPGIAVVETISADFDRQRARELAAGLLARTPAVDAFFCANDLMALGVAEAVASWRETSGRTEDAQAAPSPLVVGVDGTAEGLQAVAEGRLSATVAFSPARVAQVILEAVDQVLKGQRPLAGHRVSSELITRERVVLDRLAQAVVDMESERAEAEAREALEAGVDAATAIEQGLMKGMEEVGRLYETYEYFVPELLLAGDAMNAALDVLKPHLPSDSPGRGTVVLGVIEGDIHDIGKNIVRAMLESAGFQVMDLGKNVTPQRFVEAAGEYGAQVIAISALMTTTMTRMGEVVERLQAEGKRPLVRVILGGAPLSHEFAASVGADAYSPTAVTAIESISELIRSLEAE